MQVSSNEALPTAYRLCTEQIAHYENEGYLLYRQPVFTPEKFSRLQAIFEEDLEKYGENDLDTIHFRDARLLEFLLSEEILNMVESLVGSNIGLWSSHFISKPPHTGKATPWHEDSAYWKGRISTMEGICTIWLAMDVVTPENGCMRVIPRTHFGGFSDYEPVDSTKNIFGTQIKPEMIDESKAVYFTLNPNECSIHEARLIHGAKANISDKRRAGYTMRYFPTSSYIIPEANRGHLIWLARGMDIAGNQYVNR